MALEEALMSGSTVAVQGVLGGDAWRCAKAALCLYWAAAVSKAQTAVVQWRGRQRAQRWAEAAWAALGGSLAHLTWAQWKGLVKNKNHRRRVMQPIRTLFVGQSPALSSSSGSGMAV